MIEHRRAPRFVVAVLGLALAVPAALGNTSAGAAAPRAAVSESAHYTASAHYTPAGCARPVAARFARCAAQIWTPGTDHRVVARAGGPPADALGPEQIQDAYRLPSSGGGQTVAIVDAYGDSVAEDDLAKFRSEYGLPACTSGNGCFRKVDQRGGTAYPDDDSGWALETSLDLDAVSAACPACNILLVEGDDPATESLGAAVDTAIRLGAKFVSNSYGVSGEFADETDGDVHYSHRGAVIVASTGDEGNIVNWPASNPDVVAAGGTTLTADQSARGWDETAWADGGSGCSAYEPRPDYQLSINTACPDNRAIADVSADADPASGLAVYDTLGQGGWLRVGGTSLSAPLIASMYALAGTPASDTFPVAALYDRARAGDFFDITEGSDGNCGTVLCTARAGWDGPTGVGSPDGVAGLQQGPHGDVTGVVTDRHGAPIAGASITTTRGAATTTRSDGQYTLSGLDVGSYTITAAKYGFAAQTHSGVRVRDGATAHENFSLTAVPSATVTGTVRDGSGQGWPVYAQVVVDGYPGAPVFTDPRTGRYAVRLPRSSTFAVHIEPVYGGYRTLSRSLPVGSAAAQTADFTVSADLSSCDAPGYALDGLSTDFLGWPARTSEDGWTTQGSPGWRFDDPADRPRPPHGDDHFAIADADYFGRAMHTRLLSPSIDLSDQLAPALSFDTRYIGYRGDSAAVRVSTDGGSTWHTVWTRAAAVASGTQHVAVPSGPDVQIELVYAGTGGGYWAVDDVFVGTHTCVATPGALALGTVAEAGTGAPLDGAIVYAGADRLHAANAVATADDPAVGDGFYWLFVTRGTHVLTASDRGHVPAQRTVRVGNTGVIVRHDWLLKAK